MNLRFITKIFIIVTLVVSLIGCIENNSENNANKFLGRWYGQYYGASSEVELETEFIFYENNTAEIGYYLVGDSENERILTEWYPIEKTNETICFINTDDNTSSCYTYDFTNNYSNLTLTFLDNPDIRLVLTKQD